MVNLQSISEHNTGQLTLGEERGWGGGGLGGLEFK